MKSYEKQRCILYSVGHRRAGHGVQGRIKETRSCNSVVEGLRIREMSHILWR